MTNFDRWQRIMKDACSPQSYVDFGFFFMINAALQRRVWCGPAHFPLYPNLYIILVGEPGLGKGVTIKPVAELLKYHKLVSPRAAADAVENSVQNFADSFTTRSSSYVPDPLLFPVAADSTTYEALVEVMASSVRRIDHMQYDPKKAADVKKTYSHSSLCFILEELSSLFRRHSDDLVNFLLVAWDCGDFSYVTKGSGKDFIKRCCMSLLGGTTPTFMQRTLNSSIIGEGFSARTLFIYEGENRFNSLKKPELTPEQLEDIEVLRAHLFNLSRLFGHVDFEPAAEEYLEHWWQHDHQTAKVNLSPRLMPYYAKKNMQVKKIAMAIHFGETADNKTVTLAECQRAMHFLNAAERNMHLALTFGGRNPLGAVGRSIHAFLLKEGPQTFDSLLFHFIEDCNVTELRECLDFLRISKLLQQDGTLYTGLERKIEGENENLS